MSSVNLSLHHNESNQRSANMAKDARGLKVWHLADALVVQIYHVTKTFPRDELYGLTTQMRRAAVSVPANITEGAARKGQQEFLQFLCVASSSLSELGYHVHLSNRLGYLPKQAYQDLTPLLSETGRTLQGLIIKVGADLNKRRDGQ